MTGIYMLGKTEAAILHFFLLIGFLIFVNYGFSLVLYMTGGHESLRDAVFGKVFYRA